MMGVEEALEVARDADPNALPTWVVEALRTLAAEVGQWRRTAAVLARQVEAADAVADAWAQIPVEADVQESHVEMAAAVEYYREERR